VDEGTHSERDAGADGADVGLEGSILLRVGLDSAPCVERAVVTDDDQRPLRHPEAVIEDPAADPDTEQTPERGLERRSIEDLDNPRPRRDLPESFVSPKSAVVDRAEQRSHREEQCDETVDQDPVGDAEQQDDDIGNGDDRRTERPVEVRDGPCDEGEREEK
jgi:hypothetical protein